jgi:hypothetical protein
VTRPFKCLIGLLAALLLGLVAVGGVPAFAAEGPTISVGSAGEVAPGQEFTVPVTIEGNTGFAACSFEIQYDTAALELIGFNTTGLLQGNAIGNVENSVIGYLSLNNMADDGVLFEMTFRVRDEAVGGVYDVVAALKDGTNKNFVNADAEPVAVSFVAGAVQVPGGATDPGGSEGTGTDPGNGPSSGPGNGIVSGGPTTVTATNANGGSMQLELRGEAGNLEYSLDSGVTWNRLPADGMIVTEEGERISVFGEGDADYYVQDLPEGMVPQTDADQGVSPLIWVIALVAVAIVVVVTIVVVSRRRRAGFDLDKESSGNVGQHRR